MQIITSNLMGRALLGMGAVGTTTMNLAKRGMGMALSNKVAMYSTIAASQAGAAYLTANDHPFMGAAVGSVGVGVGIGGAARGMMGSRMKGYADKAIWEAKHTRDLAFHSRAGTNFRRWAVGQMASATDRLKQPLV
jgi:hypothetical protein